MPAYRLASPGFSLHLQNYLVMTIPNSLTAFRAFLLTVSIVAGSFRSFSQCSFKDLFPLEHNISKDEAVRTLNDSGLYRKRVEFKYPFSPYKEKKTGDSILITKLEYYIRNSGCL